VAGALVALSGALSGIFVVIANAWMNSPTGFDVAGGQPVNVDPLGAMANPAAFSQTLHMTIAAYAATGLAVAGIHAMLLLRRRDRADPGLRAFHQHALTVALAVGAPAAVLQPISGDISARFVARWQPIKLAAMEGQFATERGAPLRLGGWPNEATQSTRFAIEIPRALSLLAFHDPNAEVRGLEDFPRDEWPPVRIVHLAFQVMIALGTAMAVVSLWALVVALRRARWRLGETDNRWLLGALALVSPMGFIATEAGWIVTEVGRQPWIVYGVMRTKDALTPMPGLVVPFTLVTLLYCGLGVVVAWLLWRQIVRKDAELAR
jgi:cytochrome d ubiquinol oxidase subunit I